MKKENPALYEINTSAWLYELAHEYSENFTVGNVPSGEWDKLKELGFDYVWLMGVWKRSKEGLRILKKDPGYMYLKRELDSALPGWTDKDLTGSPYSIASYTPDPITGTWKDIDNARHELHKRGMGLILDFVPNHTAPDHPWVLDHPDYYFQVSLNDYKQNPSLYSKVQKNGQTIYIARGKDPYFLPWTDTAQMNFFNPGLRSALISELKNIAGHCDGVRCDMAMLVLKDIFHKNWGWLNKKAYPEPWTHEFWEDVRQAVPGFLLIAEAYWDTELILQQMGFDYAYDKKLYDCLLVSSVRDIYLHLKADISFQNKLVRFIENHDEQRSLAAFGKDRLFAAAVLFSTLPGLKLYHHGQMEGRKKKTPVHIKGAQAEEPDMEIRDFYDRLLHIAKQDVFHSGRWELKEIVPAWDDSCKNLIAYVWSSDKELKLIVVNLTRDCSQGRIPMKEITLDTDYILYDELGYWKYKRSGKSMNNPGLHVILKGFCSHVFDIAPIK